MRRTRIRAITAAAALALVVASLLSAVAASATDDIVEWAATDGAPVKITTNTAGQKAHVFFNVAAGRHLIVSCAPDTGASSYALERPDGSAVARRQCATDDPLAVDPLRESGRFRLRFTGENGQPFTATVKVLMVEDVTGTITPDGAPLTLETTKPEQNLSFALPLRAGQRVQMFCNAVASISAILMVGPSGKIVDGDFDSAGSCGWDPAEAGRYTANEAGTYRFVLARTRSGTGFRATVSAVSTLPDAIATLATDGTPVTIATTARYQQVRATFSVKTDTRVYITCERKTDNYTDVWLHTPGSGRTPKQCQDDGPGGEPTLYNGTVRAGTSTIFIDPKFEHTDEFTLRVHTVPAPVTAGLPLDGTPVRLETTTLGQHAQFTFETAVGAEVWIGCRLGPLHTPKPSGVRAEVELTEPGGRQLSPGLCWAPEEVGDPSALTFNPAKIWKAGTHTVTVQLKSAETTTVTVWAYKVPAPVEATAAPDGTPVTVETTVPGQQAHVRFPGVAGKKYTVSCDVTGNGQAGSVRLRSPSGSWDHNNSVYCGPAGKTTSGPLTETGDFRLEFSFHRSGTGKATLKVTPAS